MANRFTAFDVDHNGRLSNRRVWANLGAASPDGCALDADGCIWVANPMARLENRKGECLRVREGGEIVDRVETTTRAIACALGGADRRSLYILTSPTLAPERALAEHGGRVEVTRVNTPGAGLP